MFRHAIVQAPSPNFAEAITSASLGSPNYSRAVIQHRTYCEALVRCGLELIQLELDPAFPDSTFVEDTPVLTDRKVVVARPKRRRGETVKILGVLRNYYSALDLIQPPGRLDGGDVCMIENHFLIGISERTNAAGARRLEAFLSAAGFTSSCLEISGVEGLLHLKSGLSYLGEGRVLALSHLVDELGAAGLEVINIAEDEEYAANCIRVNEFVLVPDGYPKTHQRLNQAGYDLIKLDMSEFRKMDGGVSCLSLRF